VGLPGIHQEVKFVERLNVRDALAQSIRDAKAEGAGSLPIVAHKMSHRPWIVTMKAEDFFKLYREYSTEINSDGADVPQETILEHGGIN
jgi:hypothetical protein